MQKPIEPSKEDCCNSGCNPCIFDIYEKQLRLYEKYLKNGETFTLLEENGISQLDYTKFIVVKIVILCEQHNIIFFKRLKAGNKVWWKPGHHFLFKYSSPEESCTRAYTPVIIENEPRNNYDFSIIIKKYDGGVVSPHLYTLCEGCVTLWRGPYGHYDIESNKFDRLIMIAQGTGVAPFIAIINHILSNEDDMTKIMLLYCCKSVNTILFRDLFYKYKSYWNFKYEIYISTVTSNTNIRYQEPIKQNKLGVDNINSLSPFSSKDQFLICGSQQFNTVYNEYISKYCTEIKNVVLF